MSLAVKVAITSPDLAVWREAVNPVKLNAELGREYASRLKTYFELKDAKPNAKGFPRTNFWRTVADATEFESADESGATVAIGGEAGRRFALRYFGGVVKPKTAKALAIPLRPEAAGKSPREIPDLFLIRSRTGDRAMLARRENAALRVYFLLVKSTTHEADPTAMPPADETQRELTEHAETFLRLKLEP